MLVKGRRRRNIIALYHPQREGPFLFIHINNNLLLLLCIHRLAPASIGGSKKQRKTTKAQQNKQGKKEKEMGGKPLFGCGVSVLSSPPSTSFSFSLSSPRLRPEARLVLILCTNTQHAHTHGDEDRKLYRRKARKRKGKDASHTQPQNNLPHPWSSPPALAFPLLLFFSPFTKRPLWVSSGKIELTNLSRSLVNKSCREEKGGKKANEFLS